MSETVKAPETETDKKEKKEKEVRIFVVSDPMNNEKKAEGSINGVKYAYERGTYQMVPPHIAEHMRACHQAQ